MEDKDRINDQLVQNLVEAVGRRNNCLEACHEQFIVLQNLVAEVDNLCLKAEEEKRKVEEKHKQGHDALIMTLLVFTSYGIGKSKDALLQMLKARMVCKQELIFLSFFFFFLGPPRFGRAAQENNQGHRAAQKQDVAASADANNKNAST
jgi:hypothetical protein